MQMYSSRSGLYGFVRWIQRNMYKKTFSCEFIPPNSDMDTDEHVAGHSASNLYCDTCNINVKTESNFSTHICGRPHAIALERLAIRERSVYIRGFPQDHHDVINEKVRELMEEKVGGVTTVKILKKEDKDESAYGFVNFKDSSYALKALEQDGHLFLDSKRLQIRPVMAHEYSRASKKKKKTAYRQAVLLEESGCGSKSQVPDGINLSKIGRRLTNFKTVDEQLSELATTYRMSIQSAETQLAVSLKVCALLRKKFPRCMVVPFGSVISGHGTLSSDCDMCVFTNPSQNLVEMLSGDSYFSPSLLASLKGLEAKYGVSSVPTEAPSVVDTPMEGRHLSLGASSVSSMSFCSNIDSSLYPAPVQGSRKNRTKQQEYESILSRLRFDDECQRVSPIRYARCPIIRFFHRPTSLNCDLSVDNMLGPLNTRLLKAYTDFDERLAVLVPVVRMLVRCIGPSRRQLNSYAISLMLIYALQRCSPPVLPCLQNPGAWPRNMEWFRKLGFSGARSESEVRVGPWRCDFTDPRSLMPSTNTQSAVSLLLHFLDFYSSHFQYKDHVVAIHHASETALSWLQALHLLLPARTMTGKNASLFRSPLVIQDPFELTHNITKMMNQSSLSLFLRSLEYTSYILKTELETWCEGSSSIISLFDPSQYTSQSLFAQRQVSIKKPSLLCFTMETLQQLVLKVDESSEFVLKTEGTDRLDVDNPHVFHTLSCLAANLLANLLQKEFSFSCQPLNSLESMESDLSSATISMGSSEQESNISPAKDLAQACHCEGVEGEGSRLQRKRQRNETFDISLEDVGGEVREPGEISEEDLLGHGSSEEIVKKKTKLTDSGKICTDLLQEYVKEKQAHHSSYECSVENTTWIHRRRTRRKLLQPGNSSTDPEMPTASSKPCPGVQLPTIVPSQANYPDLLAAVSPLSNDSLSSSNYSEPGMSSSLLPIADSLPTLSPALEMRMTALSFFPQGAAADSKELCAAVSFEPLEAQYTNNFQMCFAVFKKIVFS